MISEELETMLHGDLRLKSEGFSRKGFVDLNDLRLKAEVSEEQVLA